VKNTAYKPLLPQGASDTPLPVRKEKVLTYLRFIGANTRRWRLKRGLTQEGLAEVADLDLRFIQRIERGATNLSVSVLVALSDALDVEPTALFKAAKLSPARPGRPRKVRDTTDAATTHSRAAARVSRPARGRSPSA
jgi:transcriptional regulator with XRE-family HTH domain